MFTGIIEEIGTVRRNMAGSEKGVLEIQCDKVLQGSAKGDSIAVNGVCLTLNNLTSGVLTADVMPQTLRQSNLGALKPGDKVNLERALSLQGRMGGHMVSGHIDGLGTIIEIKKEKNAVWVGVEAPTHIMKYILLRGSVALNGVSLTVARREDGCFYVSLIPVTSEDTNLLQQNVGSKINIECDVIGKYVEQFLELKTRTDEQSNEKSDLTEDYLRKMGF